MLLNDKSKHSNNNHWSQQEGSEKHKKQHFTPALSA